MGLTVADKKIHRISPEGKTKHFLLIFNETQPLSGPRVYKNRCRFLLYFVSICSPYEGLQSKTDCSAANAPM